MATHKQALAIVKEQLETYARRGVFRSFCQTRAGGGQAEFRFYWLWNLPFNLRFDGKRKTMSFKNLLAGVPAASELNSSLKSFVKEFSVRVWPEHRRVDPKRVSIRYSNQRGNVTIAFVVSKNEYEYGVKKALNVINEVLVGFLSVHFPEYTVEHFRRPED